MGSWRTWKKVWQSLKSSFLVKTIASSKESGWSLQPGAYSKPRLVNPDSPFRIDFFVQSLYVIGKMSFSFGQNLSVSQLDEISISVASHGYCSCGSCTMIFEAGAESLYFTGDYKLCYCLETWEWRLSYINPKDYGESDQTWVSSQENVHFAQQNKLSCSKTKDDALTTRTEESIFVAKRMGVHHHK